MMQIDKETDRIGVLLAGVYPPERLSCTGRAQPVSVGANDTSRQRHSLLDQNLSALSTIELE